MIAPAPKPANDSGRVEQTAQEHWGYRSRVNHPNGQPHRDVSVTFPQKLGEAILAQFAPGVNFIGIIAVIGAVVAGINSIASGRDAAGERRATQAHIYQAQDRCMRIRAAAGREPCLENIRDFLLQPSQLSTVGGAVTAH